MSNESDISDNFNGNESYNLEHPKGISNQVHKPDTKRMHETAFSVNCNDGQVHHNIKNNKILRTNLPTQTVNLAFKYFIE